jgi:isoleucyl-tRNA synthetase
MSKYKEYKGLNLPKVAEETLKDWEENGIFSKSISTRPEDKTWVFYEGPPSANGLPGIHHVMARSIKDIFCRYKTLKGYRVNRKAGWDTHGLPVELGVEKELGITKEDIGTKLSVDDYNKACKETVMRYTDIWDDLTKKMGYWVDQENPYITYDSKYMETVWWLLKNIYNKDLIYKGYTIQPYSPKAGTGLSSHEINQPGCYKDVTDTTIVAQFKAIDGAGLVSKFGAKINNVEDSYFLAWTTTPWTLSSNTALTVGPKIDYVLVSSFNRYTKAPMNVVLAKSLVGKQFSKGYHAAESMEELSSFSADDKKVPFFVHGQVKGSDLVGFKYEQLQKYALPHDTPEKAFVVIPGDFVTTEDGTGIVHTSPTFGADDALVAKEAGVPALLVKDENDNLVPLVDLQGRFRPEMGPYAGKYVKNEYYAEDEVPDKSVDVEIAIELKERGLAFLVEKYVHSYPHCWRTDKPVLYYPLDSWFIKITEVKNRMSDLNDTINWKPASTGSGRFGNWLENANDWNLSRSRFWGIPLPIWRSEDGTEIKIIGSIEELQSETQKSVEAGLMNSNPISEFEVGNMSKENYEKVDLHKNFVDNIILVSDSGQAMKREADLIDVWFDSGSMPYAQLHYPFENKELVDGRKNFPADYIAEGVDQTRGWFYTLHAIGTMVFDSVAYKNVISNGLVLDKNGQKMSKRLGNAADPFDVLSKYGPDATRWYMITNAQPWDNLKFNEEGITEIQRKIFGTLYNTYSFFSLYANVDGFSYSEAEVENRPEMDRWILSKLNSLIKDVDNAFDSFEPTKAGRLVNDFVLDHLSNWYVRLGRRRFWKGEYEEDKISAYQTLYTVLESVAKLMSPIAPFFSDRLFLDLNEVTRKDKSESVHISNFPEVNEDLIDLHLESRMEVAQKISSMTLGLRQKEKLKVRQPLQKIMVPVLDHNFGEIVESVKDIILSEVNVKEMELLQDTEGVLVKKIKPNFKTIGPKYGKNMKGISKMVNHWESHDIAMLEKNAGWQGDINGEWVVLELSDFEISTDDIPGWTISTEGAITVAMDVTITPELRQEGIAREVVNRVQNFRKESGLEVTDRINLIVKSNEEINEAVNNNQDYISNEVLANSIVFEGNGSKSVVEDIEGIETKFELDLSK